MATASSVRRAVEDHYTRLTAQQKRTADYLLSHHRTAFSLSVNELARQAGVSEATVVRFAREIGYAGYQEMRSALMDEVKRDLTPEDRFAVERPPSDPGDTVARVADSEVENITRTVAELDSKEFRRFVARVRKARHVATMGLGASSMLARFAQYLLFQIGVRAHYLSRDALTLAEQVAILPQRSILWVFSFPPYSKQTVEATTRASEQNIPILAIIDSVRSPLHPFASATLHACSDNVLFTNAMSSAMVLINAVVTDLALSDKTRALDQLRASIRASHNEYV
ncbi:MAG: MurR/RpiR family transcriptional regulator [Proteobacteria bacterium]|nr:MurR/RpiR family transcriptional regulator [Pseudomonadota bacterium]